MHRLSRVCCIIGLVAGAVLGAVASGHRAASAAPPGRKSESAAPLPDNDARQKAEQQVRARYKADYVKASKPDGKLVLGKKLFNEATEFKGEGAERYVLYEQAAKYAAEAGETSLAWTIIDEMAMTFGVDVIALKAAAAKGAVKLVKDDDDALALVQLYLTLMDEAAGLAQYEASAQLGAQLIQAARKANSAPLSDQMQERAKRARDLAAAYKEARPAEEKLKESPDDPKANRIWGRYLCFWTEDWVGGLPLLEKGDDPALAALAKKDLAKPTDADEIVEIADGWWTISEKEKGAPRGAIQERAFEMYRNALPGVSETQQRAVEQRALRAFGKTEFFQASEKIRGVGLGGLDADVGTAFTLELWVLTQARDGYLITKRHEENDGTLSLLLAGGKPVVHGNGSFYLAAGEARQQINDGRWHHLAAVKTGQEVELYVDGTPAAHITTREEFVSKSPWVLGFFGVGNTGQLNATFCRIRMSNVARYLIPFNPDRQYGSDKYTVFEP
jgi:hypothetical protein